MKKLILSAVLFAAITPSFAQKFMTRTGKVTFFSGTSVENIEAINNDVASVIDSKSGDVMFKVPIKSFHFEKQLMQEHFNENYMESDKFPNAEFRGKIDNTAGLAKDGTYNVKATGKLTMHGVTRDVTTTGSVSVKSGIITVNSKFRVKPGDYGIKIPSVVTSKIAEQIEVTVNTILNPLNK